MLTPPARTPRLSHGRAWLFAPVLALLLAASPSWATPNDAVTKGVWRLIYGVTDSQINETGANVGWLAKDDDGDGIKNGDEVTAGTNPFNPGSAIKVTSVTADTTNVHLTFPTTIQKQYVVQKNSDPTLAPASWAAVSPVVQVTGDGTSKTLDVPKTGSNTFYRVVVQDIDTDGDGVSDWVEQQVPGMNPNSPVGNTDDLTYVNTQLALPSEVNITASTPFASEDGPTVGGFTITRSQTFLPITVNLSTTGSTATPGSNYTALPTSVSLPVGTSTIQVPVAPIQDGLLGGSKSVKATLVPPTPGSAGFLVGSHNSATVIINDATSTGGTGLYARYYDTANGTYAHAANFGQDASYLFTRNADQTKGTVDIFYKGNIAALQTGHSVKLTFNTGSLNPTFNNLPQTVTQVGTGTFRVTVSNGASAFGFTTTSGTCNFSIQSFPHPGVLERVDSTVNFDWQGGTANGGTIQPKNSPDNYSDTFETYLVPTVSGDYVFQLDADDKAEVQIDTGSGLTQVVEHNWNSPGSDTVGTFKTSGNVNLTSGTHYRMLVKHVETTGDARCRLQWKVPGTTSFANIPQANQFTHTQAMTYVLPNSTTARIVPTGGHSNSVNDSVNLAFSGGVLFTPSTSAGNYSKAYTITAVNGAAPVTVTGASIASNGTQTVNVPSTTGLAVGMQVTGTGLPANEFITAVGPGNTITVTTGTNVTAQVSTNLTCTNTYDVTITPFSIPITGASTLSGSVAVNVPSAAGLATNMVINGTGLPTNPTISAINNIAADGSATLIISAAATSTQPSTNLTVTLPASTTGLASGFIQGNAASTTTGVFNLCYPNTAFTGSPARVAVDGSVTALNNGLWNSGTPDVNLVAPDTFSVRWTGQVQPQFSEEYTFAVTADDSCALWINGQQQVLKMAPSALTGGTYKYTASTGDVEVTYSGLTATAGSFVAGEVVRLDWSSGNLNHAPTSATTYLYDPVTNKITVDYTNLVVGQPGGTRVAGSYAVGEVVEVDPTSGSVSSLSTLPYTIESVLGNTFTIDAGSLNFIPTVNIQQIGAGAGNCVITTATPHSLTVGQQVKIVGVTGGTFSVPINDVFTVVTAPSTTTFTVASTCSVAPTTGTGRIAAGGTISIPDSRNLLVTSANATTFTVNIGTGKYQDVTTSANVNVDLVNKPLKDWAGNANERYVRIPMVGGVRYDIQLDMWESGGASRCLLSWYSPSQPKQIIPAERLYPSSTAQAPPTFVSSTDASGTVGGALSQAVAGSNGATVTLGADTPAWLSYSGGFLVGTPPVGAGGDYQITVNITNSTGTSTSVVNLHIDENVGSVVHDRWDGVAGTSVASIPTTSAVSFTESLNTLETNASVDNYGERIRGYITAPATGNYYFWIAANSPAELWISNDDDTINAFKRAWVTTGSATPQTWSGETNQKSGWLALEQGKKYYFEVLHKAAAGTGDNLAIGWSKPGQSTTAPSQVVPGSVLSPYVVQPINSTPGTLYVASLLAEPGIVVASNGVGTSTLRLSPDETVAYMRYSYSNLTGPITSQHIHIDPNPGHADGEIVYDIDNPTQGGTPGDGLITNPSDPNYGAYKWTIASHGTYTGPQILEALKAGKAYINLHTNANTAGEIRGNYTLANGTRTFSVPATPPSWTDDSSVDANIVRFLGQATFGANPADIKALRDMLPSGSTASKYEAWIDDQFTKSATRHLPEVLAREIADVFGPFDVRVTFDTWWKTSMNAQDQLRQRVAFALSQIHVVSGQGPLEDNSRAISHFYDTLLQGVETSPGSGIYKGGAFGNFRDILQNTTLTPGMGRYLDMLGNDKPDLTVGRSPNENYAREIKQLFSIGLYRMWPDGSLMLSQKDSPIDTYTQREIVGLAHVFTGWSYGYDGDWRTAMNATADWTRLMREVPARHFTGPKRLLNNEVFPGLPTLNGQTLDPYATHTSNQYTDPAYEALPAQELNAAHDMLFNHPNTGPFICRQLIQRMVTSNPSRGYLYRVVQKFNDNGSGVRGDMKAVIKAILLDYEARSSDMLNIPAYGKQREPILRVAQAARAFRPTGASGIYTQTGSPLIKVTMANQFVAGNSVFLEFTDGSGNAAPTTGAYTVLGASTNPVAPAPTATDFYILSPGWMIGNYSLATDGTVTVNITGHNLPGNNPNVVPTPQVLAQENKGRAYLKFTTGALVGSAVDQTASVTLTSQAYDIPSGVGNTLAAPSAVDGNYSGLSFTIGGGPTGSTATGTVWMARFSGSYSCTGRNGVITIDTSYGGIGTYGGAGTFGAMADHGISVGSQVFLNFTNSRDTTSGVETSTENDRLYTVTNVPDANTFTVAARDAANAAMNSDNQVAVFPQTAQPLTRNGNVIMRQSTYQMDNTDAELAQTPLNSPTVFNFFLPDYKFAGTLSSQGITTPEFQLTAQTTAVRQANFIYNGLFASGLTSSSPLNGFYNSSTSGTNQTLALALDLSPWIGTATNTVLGNGDQTGQLWTSNANLDKLIEKMDTLLTGGQLGTPTKAEIKKFLYRTFSLSAAPSSPVVLTSVAHGLAVNDSVTINGVSGGTFGGASSTINGTFLVASTPTADTFTLKNTGGTLLNYTASGANVSAAHVSPIAYNNSSPAASEPLARLRAILHLILTSPDFTIQR